MVSGETKIKTECCGKCVGSPEQDSKLHRIINEYKDVNGALIPVLHKAQEIYGYLPYSVQRMIALRLDVPLAEIYGVVTFYSQFTTEPKGLFKVNLCMGTACYVRGANKVAEKLQEKLKIDIGKCADDGKFSLDATRCIGACGLAPVLLVNDDVYGKVTSDMIDEILAKYELE